MTFSYFLLIGERSVDNGHIALSGDNYIIDLDMKGLLLDEEKLYIFGMGKYCGDGSGEKFVAGCWNAKWDTSIIRRD